MSNLAPPRAYRESAVLSAQPEQLIVMLYDGARRFLLPGGDRDGRRARSSSPTASSAAPRTSSCTCARCWTWSREAKSRPACESIYLFCQRHLLQGAAGSRSGQDRQGQRDARRAARRLGDDRAAAMSAVRTRLRARSPRSFERELELSAEGRLDELASSTADRDALIAGPSRDPARIRPTGARARRADEQARDDRDRPPPRRDRGRARPSRPGRTGPRAGTRPSDSAPPHRRQRLVHRPLA